jgi:tetratricopeptide (TPR) repeat protein
LIRLSYLSFGKVYYSKEEEQAFFAAKLALCTTDNEKAVCHLIRGIAATNCGEYQSAKADYNFALNYLKGKQVDLLACYVAHYNRAHACLYLHEFADAVADYTEAGKLYNVNDVPLNGGGEIVSANVNGRVYELKDVLPVRSSEMTRLLNSSKNVALVGVYIAERNLSGLAIILFSGVLLQDDMQFALRMMFKNLYFETLSLIFYKEATDAGIKIIHDYLLKLVHALRAEVTEHDIICKFYSKLIRERESILLNAAEGRKVMLLDIFQYGNPSKATIKAIDETLDFIGIPVSQDQLSRAESSSRNIITSLNSQPVSFTTGKRRLLIKPIEEDYKDLPLSELTWPEKGKEEESSFLLETTTRNARPC